MEVKFEPVISQEQTACLARLADEIWQEYFTVILEKEQIDYMVDRFQSESAIKEQISGQGYEYFLLSAKDVLVGYTGIRPDGKTLFLSKLYLLREHRKKGYAGQAFAFLERLCRERGLSSIWLTVNRFNEDTIEVYKKKGFLVLRTQVTDIGNGFVMDDYVMEKKL